MSSDFTVGVIVGRFQVDALTPGHLGLIDRVAALHTRVLIAIGSSDKTGSNANPLDYMTRARMFNGLYGGVVGTVELPDNASDEVWSQDLDRRVRGYYSGVDIPFTLYGSRDSFIPHYSGKYPTKVMSAEATSICGTKSRANVIRQGPIDSSDFRAGVIYATHVINALQVERLKRELDGTA